MNDLNSVLIEGRLTRDAELKYTNTGKAVCNMSIAVNRYFPKNPQDPGEGFENAAVFVDVTSWEKTAEKCGNLLKGRKVRVSGRLDMDKWTTQEGATRTKLKVLASYVEIHAEKPRDLPESPPQSQYAHREKAVFQDGFQDDLF